MAMSCSRRALIHNVACVKVQSGICDMRQPVECIRRESNVTKCYRFRSNFEVITVQQYVHKYTIQSTSYKSKYCEAAGREIYKGSVIRGDYYHTP